MTSTKFFETELTVLRITETGNQDADGRRDADYRTILSQDGLKTQFDRDATEKVYSSIN